MEAIETRTVKRNGISYRIRIHADEDAPNPLEDWSAMGTILSLHRRHANRLSGSVGDLLESTPDAVPLCYFEHGRCLWCVAGELPGGAVRPWDSVGVAGFWLPDEAILESARNYGGWTRRMFMQRRARQACDVYTPWCNGEVYGYAIERISTCECCQSETSSPVDQCWGFYGLDDCLSEATEALG